MIARHVGVPTPARLFAAAMLVAGLAMPADAAQFKWTGAASTDFSDAANWLVESGGLWVATSTPPANTYGADTIVFEGAPTANMPVLGADWKLHSVRFLSGGWTLDTGTFSLQLVQYYGTWYLGVYKSIAITSQGGGTNTINGTLWFNGGGYFSVAEECALRHVGVILGTSADLSGSTKQLGFGGGGTLFLGGAAANENQERFNMGEGTLLLGKTSGVATGPLRLTGGQVTLLGAQQVKPTGGWYLSGTSSIDFGGFEQSVAVIGIGAPPDALTTAAAWAGNLTNAQNLQVGISNDGVIGNEGRLTVNPSIQHPAVFGGGLDSRHGRYSGAGCHFMVGDSTNDVDMVVGGPLFPGNTGNGGTTLRIFGATANGQFSVGTVALTEPSTWGGNYARVYLSARLLANAPNGSSVGTPSVVDVTSPHGVLGGHGHLSMNPGATMHVYGALCPGSPQQPAGTLTIGSSSTPASIVLHTNSTFRVAMADSTSSPMLQLNGSLQIDADTILSVVCSTTPKMGVAHTILRHTGARTGTFANVVSEFPGAASCVGRVSYVAEASGGYVALHFAPTGTLVVVR